jgi:hypothetical protein
MKQTAMRRGRWLYVALVVVGRTIDARSLFARCLKHVIAKNAVLISACLRAGQVPIASLAEPRSWYLISSNEIRGGVVCMARMDYL